jgi:solute carrier family 25 carnitine/acylcarnitine transporter 20/29
MTGFNDEVVVDLIAGSASGAVSVFCSQPIDTVLTRVQAKPNLINTSSLYVTKYLLRNHGIQSLWRGSSAMIGAIPFQNAIMMAGYGYGKRWCEQHKPDNMLLGVFIGGCTAGVAQSFLMSPVELIKINQQVIGRSLSSATSMVFSGALSRDIAWKGLGATLLRDGLPHGVWFASYEYTKDYLNGIDGIIPTEHVAVVSLSSGAFAAFIAWGVGYPFDIIKTRIQALGASDMTVIRATQDILKESNGRPFSTLYRGFWMKIAKAIPASAINFYIYESVAKELHAACA